MRASNVLLALLLGACGLRSEASPAPAPESPAAPAPTTGAETGAERPRLVVSLVLDQLASHALERYLEHLPADGAIRRGIERGAFHRRVVYPYAGTYTAAGHAAIYTGAPPSVTGVFSNEVWDAERGDVAPIVDDAEHAVHGSEGAFAGPGVLRAETVADVLNRATAGRAVVASLSWKDRGAIFAGGREPDVVLWYDKRIPSFTTSAFYVDALPAWLTSFQQERPIDGLLETWEPADPAMLEELLGPDDAPGEGDWHGFGNVFPHSPRDSDSPHSVLRATPQSSEYLLSLAAAAVEALGMGEDEVPDLLAVSISSTDYVAHVFGPDSWEYLDNLIRTDRAMGAFLDALEAEHGPIAVLITSDHGGAPLPERDDGESRRIYPNRLKTALDSALDEELGRGDWVAAFVQPFVYLTPAAREEGTRERAVAAATRWLGRLESVELAVGAREATGLRGSDDPLRRAVGLSVPDDPSGDVFVVPARGWVVDEDMPEGFGTSHGTPWDYDQQVPVVFWGPGVEHLETSEPLPQGRVATTLSALLGVAPPDAAPREPLPGVPGLP